MATSPFYLKRKWNGDGMATSPFYLMENGGGMATSPFYLKGNGDGMGTSPFYVAIILYRYMIIYTIYSI